MRRFGLIGRALSHSQSAQLFEEKCRKEHLQDCRYDLFELASVEELRSLWTQIPELEGVNVTIPYKRAVMPLLDEISWEAQQIGAVNCIRKEEDGRLKGYNTDIEGLRESLGELLQGEVPEQALILGTGGASQAVQFALTELSIPFALVSRDEMKGNYTYDNLPCEVVEESHLIVNTTPVGMSPHEEEAPLIPYAYLTPEHRLWDLIYRPRVTWFLDYGMQRGAKVMNGERMLRRQAEESWKIWRV